MQWNGCPHYGLALFMVDANSATAVRSDLGQKLLDLPIVNSEFNRHDRLEHDRVSLSTASLKARDAAIWKAMGFESVS
jgi:hypothetical protein